MAPPTSLVGARGPAEGEPSLSHRPSAYSDDSGSLRPPNLVFHHAAQVCACRSDTPPAMVAAAGYRGGTGGTMSAVGTHRSPSVILPPRRRNISPALLAEAALELGEGRCGRDLPGDQRSAEGEACRLLEEPRWNK